MKKRIITIMAAVLLFAFVGCGQKEQVDEEDMSRWVIEFSSEYPNDMENGKTEMTVEELKERNYNENDFTIKFQYKLEYAEIGNNDHSFNLLPEMTLYYVNDAGEKIKDGMLNDYRYYVKQSGTYKYDEDDERFERTMRVVLPGVYQIHYDVMKDDENASDFANSLDGFIIKIEIGNLT